MQKTKETFEEKGSFLDRLLAETTEELDKLPKENFEKTDSERKGGGVDR